MKHLQDTKILEHLDKPDKKIEASKLFNIETDMKVDIFSKRDSYVPEVDNNYIFDKNTTLAILAGFQFNSDNDPRLSWNRKIYSH